MEGEKALNDFLNEIKKRGAYEVSLKSGVKHNTIWSWINRGQIPRFDKMQKVASAMGMEFLLFDKI